MSKLLTVAIAGCSGRMGQMLVAAAREHQEVKLVAGSVHTISNQLNNNLYVTSNPVVLAEKADAIIDFTTPESTIAHAQAAAKLGKTIIIGTTGFSDEQQKKINSYARDTRIVQSGNFSMGVNILESLVEKTATMLSDQYDIEINEMHHKHKKDAPSGTAIMMGKAAARGREINFDEKKVIDRNGTRKKGDIGFSVSRGGDVVGIHNVMFAGGGELITLSHQGFSRNIYATGAIAAVLWAKGKANGLYSMRDVLGL
ncbi:MAG: 4-hydroxy-tetrahydrodipicolinate reductase [Rickettsiales bacterium]